MAGLFSAPQPKIPKIEPTPAPTDPAVQEARRRQLVLASRAAGRRSTLLTGGAGVGGAAPVARKALLAA